MILPGGEPRIATIPVKVGYEISLEYQLAKVMLCAEKFMEKFHKDQHVNDLEDETYYLFDTLINSATTLIEYYFSNVIYSLIGTVIEAPKKVEFRAFNKSNYINRKAEIFKEYKIGELINGDVIAQKKHTEQCEQKFDLYLNFIINERYDLFFEINNYLKHNGRLRGFWLKKIFPEIDFIKHHFIRFEIENAFLLKNKAIKKLLDIDFGDFNPANLDEFFVGEPYKILGHHGGSIYVSSDDWVYVKGSQSVGITSLSVVIKVYQLCLEVINHLIPSKPGEITTLIKLNSFKEKFEKQLEKLMGI